MFGKTSKCGVCGRGTPRGVSLCPRHQRQVRRESNPTKSSSGGVKVCGRRLRNGGTCHRSVASGETCSNPLH